MPPNSTNKLRAKLRISASDTTNTHTHTTAHRDTHIQTQRDDKMQTHIETVSHIIQFATKGSKIIVE